MASKTLLSFGHGYSAQALAARLIPSGWRVIGTTRNANKAASIAQSGAIPLIWPGQDVSKMLEQADALLISAAPTQDGDPILAALRQEILQAAGRLEWVGYLSTTGVYGDHGGGWVDENTPLHPSTARGRARVAAETEWKSLQGVPLHIFRLAGIYGPGRGPFSKVRAGTARRIEKQDQVFSRIHVEDIAQVLEASLKHPNPGAVYNVCDDDPAPPQDVISYAAHLLGLPEPPMEAFETADLTPMARSFYSESKKVRNDRIKDKLGVTLKYPDYKAGLSAMKTGLDA